MLYYREECDAVLHALQTDRSGLSEAEAAHRQQTQGYNELVEEKRKSLLQVFFSQFRDLLVIILLVSALISVFTGNADSAVVILCVITMNAVIGTVQHVKAEKSLASLKAMSAPVARVLRDGKVCEIPAREVCVGDCLLLEAGDIAAADGRVLKSAMLTANESSLTGESQAVQKQCDAILGEKEQEVLLGDRCNMVYAGSCITNGRGILVVTEIGMQTELGKIARLLSNTQQKKTPLQMSLDGLSKWLSIGVLLICLLVMGLSLLRGEPLMQALMFAVALAVAAIPEALSAIVTISLAIGTQKMAKAHAIMKELKAVEGLGCVSVICSDKTGTLTQNRMTVREVYVDGMRTKAEAADWSRGAAQQMQLGMVLCNDAAYSASGMLGDPTETALLACFGADCCQELRESYPRQAELPFDSERKCMSTLHKMDGCSVMLTKGAVDLLLGKLTQINENGVLRPITPADIAQLQEVNRQFSAQGMRVLCFAARRMSGVDTLTMEAETDYSFLGLAAMTDPPRVESAEAVAACISAGIRPIMITGDHKETATAIAKEIGIFCTGDLVLDGAALETLDDSELTALLPRVSVYARVSPVHKIRIVSLWQQQGQVVAMTGDGVNDAPALKQADVGVAMGITGTQVSKDAAAMILTDDNFATIVTAVSNGRSIYQNIKNAVKFLISGNIAGILAVLYAVLAALPMPFSAVHLLFINLLTDSLPAIAISMEQPDHGLMRLKPRKREDGLLDRATGMTMLAQGLLLAVATILSYHIGLADSAAAASTMAFATLCLARLFACFNCRGEKPINQLGFRSNPFSLIAFFAGTAFLAIALFLKPLHTFLHVTALTAPQYAVILGFAFLPTLLIQLWKMWRLRKRG